MNNNTKKTKENQVHFRAEENYCNTLNSFIKSHDLNKSEFIRDSISKEMKRIDNGDYDTLLRDNKLYNFLLLKSAKSRTCKELLKEFERSCVK